MRACRWTSPASKKNRPADRTPSTPTLEGRPRNKTKCTKGVREERPHAHEKLRGKIFCLLVHHIARRVAEPEKTHVEHLQLEQPAEEQMARFMNNHAGKRKCRNHRPGNEEHT